MIKSRFFTAAALTVGVLASSACATGYAYGQGTYRDRGPYANRGYYREAERRAYDNGFRDGIRAGERDGRSNRRFEPSRHGDWRNANDGYRREYGDPNFYRRTYRSAFESGYSQAYRQNDRGRNRRW
jgi:hypothetical protein